MSVGYYWVKLPSLGGFIGLADLLGMLCKYFSELVGLSSSISFGVGLLDVCQRDV
jgi:hypothetical protein